MPSLKMREGLIPYFVVVVTVVFAVLQISLSLTAVAFDGFDSVFVSLESKITVVVDVTVSAFKSSLFNKVGTAVAVQFPEIVASVPDL